MFVTAISRILLVASLVFPTLGFSDSIPIEPAAIRLLCPPEWETLDKNSLPDAAPNVCFPRIKMGQSRIDVVLWEQPESLNEAVDKYTSKMPGLLRKGATWKEISRGGFRANSGVEGVRLRFSTTEMSDCGPRTTQLVRYVFKNRLGKIVCIGGIGDLEAIQGIVISSLELTP